MKDSGYAFKGVVRYDACPEVVVLVDFVRFQDARVVR